MPTVSPVHRRKRRQVGEQLVPGGGDPTKVVGSAGHFVLVVCMHACVHATEQNDFRAFHRLTVDFHRSAIVQLGVVLSA